MDRRTLLAVFLIMAVLMVDQLLWSRWTKSRQPQAPPDSVSSRMMPGRAAAPEPAGQRSSPAPGTTSPATSAPASLPTTGGAPGIGGEMMLRPRVPALEQAHYRFATERFDATISSHGAAVTSWVLGAYRDPIRKEPVNLVPEGQTALHVVVGLSGGAYDFSRVPFRLEGGSELEGRISFVAEDSSGIRVTKIYRKSADPALLDLEVRVTAPPDLGPIRYRIGWASPLPLTEQNAKPQELTAVAYLGAKLESVDMNRIAKDGMRRLEGNVRWAGERSKYFLAALIPDSATVPEVVFLPGVEKKPTAWLAGVAPPGSEVVRHARLYAGPIDVEELARIGSGLDETANLGWKWIVPLSKLLLGALILLHGLIPNYGVAIILLSVLTKLIFHPLSHSSLRTMKVMHRLQPQIDAMRQKYKNDPQKLNQAMMNLYKEHKVNPLGGCLPMLLQLPVFLALYNVLLHSIELRAAGFVGYIADLSAPDVLARVGGFPIHLLPILMTGSTYLLQSQTPVAPQQKLMMYLMPGMMLYIMYGLPSGVILYWTVNNLVSALQQYIVNVAEDRKAAAA
jgi:YidC/Oxa1 family membrane protein insertase